MNGFPGEYGLRLNNEYEVFGVSVITDFRGSHYPLQMSMAEAFKQMVTDDKSFSGTTENNTVSLTPAAQELVGISACAQGR